jgi:D-alanyl-D-alanine carboxypeptidase
LGVAPALTGPGPCIPGRPAPARHLEAELGAVVEKWREGTGVPGVTVAVALPESCVIAVASGVARKAPEVAMEPTSRMPAGSVGKTFCAAVVLQLAEESGEELNAFLDSKVSRWLGNRAWYARLPNARDITLRHVMQHTSGIPEHVQSESFTRALAKDPMRVWSPEELLAYVMDGPALFDAGQGWSYADTNYIVVGLVVETIAGKPYYEEATRRVLVGLKDTIPQDKRELGIVSGYTWEGNPFPVPQEVAADGAYAINPQFEWTGGGIVSTSHDLAVWSRRLYAGDVLKPETRAVMLTGVKARTGPNDEYGLGVQMYPTRYGKAVGHSGWFPGYTTMVAYYPEKDIAVAVQVNTDIRQGAMRLRAMLDSCVDAVGGEE